MRFSQDPSHLRIPTLVFKPFDWLQTTRESYNVIRLGLQYQSKIDGRFLKGISRGKRITEALRGGELNK